MPWSYLIPPAVCPLHRDEVKGWLRVDSTDQDTLIDALILAGVSYVQNVTSRQLVTAKLKQTRDLWPLVVSNYYTLGRPDTLYPAPIPGREYWRPDAFAIDLERPPCQSIVSIDYLGGDGTNQTVDPTVYTLDIISEPARVAPAFGKIWPVAKFQINAISISYIAGWLTRLLFVDNASAGDTIQAVGRDYANGDAIQLSNSGGALPGGLTAGPTYYVRDWDGTAKTFNLAATSGGDALPFTGNGSGYHFAGLMPAEIKHALQLFITANYERRSEGLSTEAQRAVDNLLQPTRSLRLR